MYIMQCHSTVHGWTLEKCHGFFEKNIHCFLNNIK